MENARRINKSCALCHGMYGQGTPGALSPRLSGLAPGYLKKEMKFYRDGTREYAPMVLASSINKMSDKDIEDISEYLAAIDLEAMDLPEVPVYPGESEKGREIFLDECKSCHKKTGRGKPKKDIPMVAGQYGIYLHNQLKKFQARDRYHDDDSEDDLFDEYDDETLKALVASLTVLTKQQSEKRKLAAIKEKIASKDETTGMTSMEPGKSTTLADVCEVGCSTADDEFAGRFRITSSGELVLSPRHKDLRQLAGAEGVFKVNEKGGLEFIRDPVN
jgi:cytochrome c553